MTAAELLLRAIRRTQRRSLLLGLGRTVLSVFVGAAGAVLASGAVLPWIPEGGRGGCVAVFLLVAITLGAVLGVREWRGARPRLLPGTAALRLTRDEPALRELVLTGTDLAAWGDGGAELRGASPELVDAQVEAAGAAAGRLRPARAVPAGPTYVRLVQAGLGAALLFAWVGFTEVGPHAWALFLAGGVPDAVTVGNLRLVYVPPAYTGLPERRVEGAEGSVQGYPGTLVTVEGELSRPVERGRWEGPEGRSVPLELDGTRFRVAWVLDKPGFYSLAFEQGRRAVPCDFSPRSISLTEDARPSVEMTQPEGDLEVTSDQEVEVAFSATDDFVVERAELVLQGAEEVRIPLSVDAARRVEGKVRFLPLAHPELGEGAHLRVEAWDGDTVSGPKAGSGRSVYVSFLDKRRLVAEIAGLEERLLEALLGHLADHLELPNPTAEEMGGLRSRAGDLLRLFEELADRVRLGAEEGALGAVAVLKMEAGLRAALEPFLGGETERGGLVEELERDILFLDRLLKNLRMEEALSLGDELAALQRSLFDDLRAGANPEQLLERVQQIQQLLAQMAEKLTRSAGEMPDAFANADAVRDMPASDLEQTLQELRDALERGDREAAQALAEKLLETLSRWMAALEEAAGKASEGQLDPLMQELSQAGADVQDLAAEQEKLLQETRGVGRDVSERAAAQLRQELDGFLAREEARLRAIEAAARRMEAGAPRVAFHGQPQLLGTEPPRNGNAGLELLEARQRLGAAVAEVRDALREDLGRAREGAETLGESVEALRRNITEGLAPEEPGRGGVDQNAKEAQAEVQGLIQDLEALAGRRREGVRPEEREALGNLGSRQGDLGGRTESLAERLESLAERSPFVDRALGRRAREARQAMGEAEGGLGQGDPFGPVPPETRALEGLSEIGRQLQAAGEQLGQGQQPGPGLQVMRRPGNRSGQGRDVDRSPVEIPREMEARELRDFREEVLRAMQGRYPKDYEDEVGRYYERLIR